MTPQGSGSEADLDRIRLEAKRAVDAVANTFTGHGGAKAIHTMGSLIAALESELSGLQSKVIDIGGEWANVCDQRDSLETELGSLRTRLEGMRGDATAWIGYFYVESDNTTCISKAQLDAAQRLSSAVLALLGKGE